MFVCKMGTIKYDWYLALFYIYFTR
jgi:hypothetical protein